ncbi:angiopoietin-1 [Bactrocera dorsalis]|uniref:Angiopoietin-1 n=1 Tax=Bactrocera dorsalis TaxID=27457 RepID=A0A6I9V0H5_BACDO|nr:angiopoietin-1 [Bactrocera dorsalis]
MVKLQRAFVTAVLFSIFIFTNAFFVDNKRTADSQTDTLNILLSVLTEYVLNRRTEVNTRITKNEQRINLVLQKQAELERKINEHASTTGKPSLLTNDEISDSYVPSRSCADILPDRFSGDDGIYSITPLNVTPFEVYCLADPLGGCGWTLVWRRNAMNTEFNRTWEEYQNGFGALTDNFFIGLDKLYVLTNAEAQQLRIGTKYGENNWEFEIFEEFAIGSVRTQYEVFVKSGNNKSSIFQRLGRRARFFTKDLESSWGNEECAKVMGVGWWYSDDCKTYLKSRPYYMYINSPTYMVIRPKSCDNKG